MALFVKYLHQHRRWYCMGGLFWLVFFLLFLLYRLPLKALLYPSLLCLAAGLVFTVADFYRTKKKQAELHCIHTIADTAEDRLPTPSGMVEEEYQSILRQMREEHIQYAAAAEQAYGDMVDYYTVWAHQIKTPIASLRLHLQTEDSALSRQLYGDLYRIEQYVEMVLTFLRLQSDSSDYVIREYDLDSMIRQAVKKFSHEFIARKLRLVYEPVEATVITDEKWLSFVLEQVLSNALKYTRVGSIAIGVTPEMQLYIRDTGIGIAPEDLPRIFENGFTGYNGRRDKKASGIGLYLCKQICGRLGHGIAVHSVLDEGTTVILDLAQTKVEVE